MRGATFILVVIAGCASGRPPVPGAAKPPAATMDAAADPEPAAANSPAPAASDPKPGAASPPVPVAAMDAACKRGDMDACARLGAAILSGKAGENDPERGGALIERACEGGHMKACWLLAMGDETAVGVSMMTKACMGGVPMACQSLGMASEDAEDEAAARRWYDLECKAGGGRGCFWIADRVRDRAKRLAALHQACDVPWRGYDLMLDGDDELPRDAHKGCTALARAYYDDKAAVGPAQATRALEGLCERGVPLACSFAADQHFGGDGVPRSETSALRWTERGCELGNADACYLLGRRIAVEVRTEADRARAVRYLTLACDAEHASACDWLARVKR